MVLCQNTPLERGLLRTNATVRGIVVHTPYQVAVMYKFIVCQNQNDVVVQMYQLR